MAYTKAQTTEHPSRTIIKTMQSCMQTGVFPKLMLLCGKEDFLVSWSLSYLKGLLVNPASENFDFVSFQDEDYSASDIITACDSPAFMSKIKLVAIKDSDLFTLQPKDLPAIEVDQLCKYLADIPDGTMLVFTCSKPNKTKALYKAVAKYGIIYDFTPLDDATLGGWMAKRFAAAGKTASRQDMIDFAKICGYSDEERNYTLYNLENDLKLIFDLYDKQELSLSDMLSEGFGQAEINSFALLDSAFSGKKGKALDILHSSIDISAPSKEIGIVLSFLGLLISQLEIMLEGKERLADGQSTFEAVSEMKVHEFRFKKAMESCKGKSIPELREALNNALQIEKDVKSGDINGRLALEMLIASL